MTQNANISISGFYRLCKKTRENVAISKKGFSQLYVAPKRTSMDGALFREKPLSRLIKFIDKNYDSRDQDLFWPDLATCHYKKENLDFLCDNGIAFVEKAENPPNAPQMRPNGLQIL